VPRRLKGINQQVSSIPELLPYFKGLLIVDTKFEYEWEGNPISTRPVKKHFVRIVMEPALEKCSGEWRWHSDPSGVGESWQFVPNS
jgi:hypothetical protein